jgi:MFS family permease
LWQASSASSAGFALGLIATAVQVGNTVGPAVGGVAVGPLGFRGSFLVAGVLLLAAGLMAIFWIDEPAHVKARARLAASKGNFLSNTLSAFGWPEFRVLLILSACSSSTPLRSACCLSICKTSPDPTG